MPEDVKSKISELEKELYSKDFKQHRVEDILQHKEPTSEPAWNTNLDEMTFLENKARNHRIMKKFVHKFILAW